ncbi:MAG: RNA polymerase sigma factor [Verrucomicrobiota bacterium]
MGLTTYGERRAAFRKNVATTVDESFETTVGDYYEDLYRFAFSLAKNPADASDLVQETYLKFANKRKQIRDMSKVKSWLFTTLYRLYLAIYRKQTKFPKVELEDAGAALPSTPPQQELSLEGGVVLEALEKIDEKYRAPLSLFFLDSLSYQEISDVLSIPIGTVMSRIHRAKAMLKKSLRLDRADSGERGEA